MSGNRTNESIQQLAYQLWQQRGGAGGSPEDDWYQAEQMLAGDLEYGETPQPQQQAVAEHQSIPERKVDRAVEESFPASDPPAVHIKDEPPVNAGDKWKAVNEAKDEAKAEDEDEAKESTALPPKSKPGKPNRRGANP